MNTAMNYYYVFFEGMLLQLYQVFPSYVSRSRTILRYDYRTIYHLDPS